jgi:hypothetical protein
MTIKQNDIHCYDNCYKNNTLNLKQSEYVTISVMTLNVHIFIYILSVIMLNAVMLNVVAPNKKK